MHNIHSQQRLIAVPLFVACLAAAGCDGMAGKAMEAALEQGVEDALPESLYVKLKAEKSTCPSQINEYTVLKDVSLHGLDRIRYTYVVSESGRPHVNMLYQGKIHTEVLERAKASHLGPAIAKTNLGIDHFFEDADGKCLLWMEMTSKDYQGLDFVDPVPASAANVSLVKHTSEADRSQMLAHLEEEQAICPRQISSHTSLKSVKLKGANRIKYLYVVTKDGLPHVNMDMEQEVRQEVIDRTKSTPLGASIIQLDLGVEHFFQSTDGKCMLWLQLTKKDFEQGPTDSPEPIEEAPPEPTQTATPEPTQEATPEPTREATPEPEAEVTPPTQIEAYLPDKTLPTFGSPITPAGVQRNPYVK